jgi:hypothetical protein
MTTDRDPIVIALVGRSGAGKDLAAEHLVHHYGFVQAAFADSLKYMLEAHFVERGVDYAHIYEPGQKDLIIDELGVSARELMQRLGDAFRAADPNYWVKALADIVGLRDGPHRAPVHDRIVISDCRYPNEAAWLATQQATLVRLVRDTAAPVREHASEQAVDHLPCDHTIVNNGSSPIGLYLLLDGLMADMGMHGRDRVGQP